MEQVTIIRRKIYDPLQRVLHWVIALASIILLITGMSADLFEAGAQRNQLWHIHIKIGYILIVALALRFIWGLIGPRFARLHDLLKYFKKHTRNSPHKFTQFGHDPKAALAYLGVYGCLTLMIATGLGLAGIEHNLGLLGPLTFDRLYLLDYFQVPHQTISYFILLFIFTHLGALLLHQYQHKLPMLYSMFDGIQYRFKKNNHSKKNRNCTIHLRGRIKFTKTISQKSHESTDLTSSNIGNKYQRNDNDNDNLESKEIKNA